MDREIQDCFLSSGCRINRLELLIMICSSISFLCRLKVDLWHSTATRHFNAQQSSYCSSCLQLQLSSQAVLIQIYLLIILLRLRCASDKLATATARRMCSDRAPARKRTVAIMRRSASKRGRANERGWQEQGAIYQNTCRYMQILPNTYGTFVILTCQYTTLT